MRQETDRKKGIDQLRALRRNSNMKTDVFYSDGKTNSLTDS